MNSYEKFYLEKLYPFQDGVMRIIRKLSTPFFLTGGTALSRHYFNHRFSEDLDLFVISDDDYAKYIDRVFNALNEGETRNLWIIDRMSLKKYEYFSQLFLLHPEERELKLKVDFVNDVAKHFGSFEEHPALGRIDGWRNILSNKISALFRFEPKDVADIWIISINRKFDWKEIIREAKTKEAGVEPEMIYNTLRSFPEKQLNLLKWIQKPDLSKFRKDIDRIADDIFYGRENSLVTI